MNTNKPHRPVRSPQKRARVGERIKIAATSAGLSLKALAARVGCPPSLMYQYVRGITNIPDDTLQAIARSTGVVLEFFDPDKDARAALAMPADPDAADQPELGVRVDKVTADIRQLEKLAEAYGEPGRNVSGLMGALNQMLALARVKSDRQREAWVLWRLGTIHRELGECEEAQRLLGEAESLFAQEGLEDYRARVKLDLGITMGELGFTDNAAALIESVASQGDADLSWRALMNLGNLYYRAHRLDEALRAFARAASALEGVDPLQRDTEGIPSLVSGVADIAMDTGHYESALALWTRSLAQAAEERKGEMFLEALLNTAQACQTLGKVSEARRRLEQAVTLASFLLADANRVGVARAQLADVMVALGALDQAREEARGAMRSAMKGGAPKGMILASLALAETSQAAGQLDEALSYAQDALQMAERSSRPREEAMARNAHARISLQIAHQAGSEEGLRKALDEARNAVAFAEKIGARREEVEARLTLAQCLWRTGDEAGAEAEAAAAVKLTRDGATDLARLLGAEARDLPTLLSREPLDLPRLFADPRLSIPAVEWQAHYLQGTLQARRLGPASAFVAVRDAAVALSRLLSGLSPEDAEAFRRQHPQIAAVYEDLARFALTEEHRAEAQALLESAKPVIGAKDGGQARLPAQPAQS